LATLGLHKAFLKGYRPPAPDLTFLSHFSKSEKLSTVLIYPLERPSSNIELTMQEYLNLFEAVSKHNKGLKRFEVRID
jgi:hypothetical protein